jgi:hypothetical protein
MALNLAPSNESESFAEDELYALKAAVEMSVRPEDLKQGLEAFAQAAIGGEFQVPRGYAFVQEPTAFGRGIVGVLTHFLAKKWHGDNITAIGIRIRCVLDALAEYDWITVNLFKISEDHHSFYMDNRLIQAAAEARIRYDINTQTARFDKNDFLKLLRTFLSK